MKLELWIWSFIHKIGPTSRFGNLIYSRYNYYEDSVVILNIHILLYYVLNKIFRALVVNCDIIRAMLKHISLSSFNHTFSSWMFIFILPLSLSLSLSLYLSFYIPTHISCLFLGTYNLMDGTLLMWFTSIKCHRGTCIIMIIHYIRSYIHHKVQ